MGEEPRSLQISHTLVPARTLQIKHRAWHSEYAIDGPFCPHWQGTARHDCFSTENGQDDTAEGCGQCDQPQPPRSLLDHFAD